MTDLEKFIELLKKAKAGYNVRQNDFYTRDTVKLVEVMPGYRCHFEAEFDSDDNIISIGQWDEL